MAASPLQEYQRMNVADTIERTKKALRHRQLQAAKADACRPLAMTAKMHANIAAVEEAISSQDAIQLTTAVHFLESMVQQHPHAYEEFATPSR